MNHDWDHALNCTNCPACGVRGEWYGGCCSEACEEMLDARCEDCGCDGRHDAHAPGCSALCDNCDEELDSEGECIACGGAQ